MKTRIFVFSDEIFSGYEVVVNVSDFDTLEIITAKVVSSLLDQMERLHLRALVERIHMMRWHIHDVRLEDILKPQEYPFHVCGHCGGTTTPDGAGVARGTIEAVHTALQAVVDVAGAMASLASVVVPSGSTETKPTPSQKK